jgi:adenosylcobyric acid synthase
MNGTAIHDDVESRAGTVAGRCLLPVETRFALDGRQAGAVSGTLWHGIFENDQFCRSCLTEVARAAGRGFVPAADMCFGAARQAQFDALADAIDASLDASALLRMIEHGPAGDVPTLRPVR